MTWKDRQVLELVRRNDVNRLLTNYGFRLSLTDESETYELNEALTYILQNNRTKKSNRTYQPKLTKRIE